MTFRRTHVFDSLWFSRLSVAAAGEREVQVHLNSSASCVLDLGVCVCMCMCLRCVCVCVRRRVEFSPAELPLCYTSLAYVTNVWNGEKKKILLFGLFDCVWAGKRNG